MEILRNKSMKKLIQLTFLALFTLMANMVHAETVTYYINDALGSPVAAMDSAGTVIWRESYNPFGEGRNKPSQNQNDVGFTGHQKDDATGLTYMQARYYDPTIGRFYGVDPAPFSNVQNFNRFAYANNNPYKYVDPDGKFANFIIGAVIGGVAAGLSAAYAGESLGDAIVSTLAGAAIGALTGGASATAAISTLAARVGISSVRAVAATSGAVSGSISAAGGNTVGQGVGMATDLVSGDKVRDFSLKKVGDAGIIGAAAGLVTGALAGDAAALGVGIETDSFAQVGLATVGEVTSVVAAETLKEIEK